jgi:hypothetical protein
VGRFGCQASLRSAGGPMMRSRPRPRWGSISSTTPQACAWGHAVRRARRRGRVRTSCRLRLLGEAADLAVAQPVVGQGQHPAGDRHPGLVLAATVSETVEVSSQLRAAVVAGDALNQRPPQQLGAVLICGPGGGQACGGGSAMVHRARHTEPAAVSGGEEGGQGRAGGPPAGAALTARSVAASTMCWEPARGSLSADCCLCKTSFHRGVGRRMRASLLISALGVANGVGCKMAFGVSRREVVRPLVLGRLSSRGWQQQGCGELVADHRLVDAGAGRR